MSILKTSELKKYYGTDPNLVRALDGVNLLVEHREFIAIVGTSGSGKSTVTLYFLLIRIFRLEIHTQEK